MPELYDSNLGPALFAPFAEHLASAAGELAPASILELAAGTGITTAALLRELPDARIVATDLNPAMVAWARERHPTATWGEADAQSLDLPDSAFDLVVCQFGVMFFPDKRLAFAEAARVLRPTGSLLFTAWDVVEASTFANALVESLAVVLPEDPPSFLARVPYGYAHPALIEADLGAAGLLTRGVERIVLRGRASSAHSLAEGFCLGSPLRFELAERGPLELLTARVARELTDRLGAGPVEGDLTAYLVTATPAGTPSRE
jgi:SAM-dependent methyltransferase